MTTAAKNGWILDPDNIMSAANVERMRKIVEDEGPIIVQVVQAKRPDDQGRTPVGGPY
jgi:hypothetical protein